MQFLSRVFIAGLAVALTTAALLRPRRRPRQRSRTPEREGRSLITGDGACLPLAIWAPRRPVRAVMLGLHGYGDYGRAFELVGPWFAARDVAFFAYDQRGFGETARRGTWPGSDGLIADLADAVTVLRREHEGLPLFVLGESMGGSIALSGLARGRVTGVDGLILAAPGVCGDVPVRRLHDLALRLGALALPWLAGELRRGGRPWLHPDEARRLADDPLILRQLDVGAHDGLIELAELASAEPRVDPPPTLLLHGTLDRTVPRGAIHALAEALGDAVTLRLYPERHHLLLHEIDAARVLADCLDWLAPAPCSHG